jgi:hypothetical protein
MLEELFAAIPSGGMAAMTRSAPRYHHGVRDNRARDMTTQFGYRCEYCKGMVRAKRVEREAFKHKAGLVILAG